MVSEICMIIEVKSILFTLTIYIFIYNNTRQMTITMSFKKTSHL